MVNENNFSSGEIQIKSQDSSKKIILFLIISNLILLLTVLIIAYFLFKQLQSPQLTEKINGVSAQNTISYNDDEVVGDNIREEQAWLSYQMPLVEGLDYFKRFETHYPSYWMLNEEINNYSGSAPASFKIKITSPKGSSINISQHEGGAGGCLFPGDPNYEGDAYVIGMASKFHKPIMIISKNDYTDWAVALRVYDDEIDPELKKTYTVCEIIKQGGRNQGYIGFTSIGWINLQIDEGEIGDIESILEQLKINE